MFWNILEPSGSLEPSEFQLGDRRTDRQTDIRTSRAAPSQLKILLESEIITIQIVISFCCFLISGLRSDKEGRRRVTMGGRRTFPQLSDIYTT